jgi:monoamine oxidase
VSTLQFDQNMLGFNADVVIIGAGMAGLVATRRLIQEGVNVLTLEARDRAGGRMGGGTFNGESYDLGAQWIDHHATAVRTLVHELGIPLTNQFHDGESSIGIRNRKTRFAKRAPLFAPHVALDYRRVIRLLDDMARRLNAPTDESLERARRIDMRSFAAWLSDTCRTRTMMQLFTVLTRIHFHAEPSEISLYYIIDQVSAHRGAAQLFRLRPAHGQERVVGGSIRIAERLSQQFRQQIIVDTPILAMRQDEHSVTAYSRGTSFRARYAILTTPPVVSQQIYFEPHLPPARDALQQRIIMGRALTMVVFYDYPFWRENGKSGMIIDDAGPFSMCHDVSPVNATEGALACVLSAEAAHHWGMQPRNERLAAVINQLQQWFGPEALAYRGMIERDWNAERWNRGANGFLAPGAASYIHNVATPVGRLHWAGSETATHWTNTLEGAIESGERAAAEVMVELGSAGLLRTP